MKQVDRDIERDARALAEAYLRDVTHTGQAPWDWLDDDDSAEAYRVRVAFYRHLRNLEQAGTVIPGLAADGVGPVYVRVADVPSYLIDVHPLWAAIRDGTLGRLETRDAVRTYARAWRRYWQARGVGW